MSEQFCPENIQRDVDLSDLLFTKTGGKAQYYLSPKSIDDIHDAIQYCKDKTMPITYIGRGSNILVSDEGVKGLVIQTSKAKGHHFCGSLFSCISGLSLKSMAKLSIEAGFTGLENFFSLAGTVGGAIATKKDAFGVNIFDNLLYVDAVDENKNIIRIWKDILLKKEILNVGILEATFSLKPSNNSSLTIINAHLIKQKGLKTTKPYIGPLFKIDNFKSLLEDMNILHSKGRNCHLSQSKGNYILNDGQATSKDIADLYYKIKKQVEDHYKIKLISNITFLGSW